MYLIALVLSSMNFSTQFLPESTRITLYLGLKASPNNSRLSRSSSHIITVHQSLTPLRTYYQLIKNLLRIYSSNVSIYGSCWNRRRFFCSMRRYWHDLFSTYGPPTDCTMTVATHNFYS